MRRTSVVMAACALLALLGCTGNVQQVSNNNDAAEVGQVTSQAVDSTGGTVKSAGATATVELPAGALASAANITITVQDKAAFPAPTSVISHVYDLGPTGTQFAQPVTVTLKALTSAPDGSHPVLAFLNAQSTWQVVPNSSFDSVTQSVSGQVTHFTQFAVITVATSGTGCAASPDPNAFCSPNVCAIDTDTCVSPPAVVSSFFVGGTLTGLTEGAVVLENLGGDLLTVSNNGTFLFGTAVDNGATYLVSVAQQPNNQWCTVSNSTGIISGADISNVQVDCLPAFDVGGVVVGLALSGNVVLESGLTQVTVTADSPNFVVTRLPSGTAYNVSIATQPAGQDCNITGASGTVARADVNTIVVQCSSLAYPLGGSVTGLVGSANVTLRNGSDVVSLGNGSYRFATSVTYATSYAVSVTSPAGQTCAVNGNSTVQGTMPAAALTTIDVTCTPLSYGLGGSVSGLLTNTNVTLNNGADTIAVANSNFTFPTAVPFNSNYHVSVVAPAGQVCVPSSPGILTGVMPAASLQNITIACSLAQYPVSGQIVGLVANTNVTLSNGADTIAAPNGHYAFPTLVAYTRPYAVSIVTSPAFQSCVFTNSGTSSGTVPIGGVSNANITCTPQSFSLGGTISGLTGNANVTLQNGPDTIATTNGSFTFPTHVPYGANYNISLATPLGQTCAFSPANAGNAIMPAAAVSNLTVVCAATQYPLGGTISGLVSNTNVTLTNGNDTVSVSNGAYSFPTRLVAGTTYAISLTAPNAQTCVFSPSGVNAGTMPMAAVGSVNIVCTPQSFSLGGHVAGLVANMNVSLTRGGDTVSTGNGAYTFPTPVAYGANFNITVAAPLGQSCVFGNGNSTYSGIMAAANTTNIDMTCSANTYTVGGSVTGLVTSTNVTLQNGNDTVTATNGTYTFPTRVAYNTTYNVSLMSPAGQTCAFSGAHGGTMGAGAVSNIGVACTANTYSLGGSISGLINNANVTVRQGGDTLVASNGSYTLPTPVAYAAVYDITLTSPAGQTCTFGDGNTFAIASMGTSNVTNANVSCSPSQYSVGGTVTGLVGSGNVTLQNGSDSLSAHNGAYTFATTVAYNSNYNVTLASPAGQTCVFSGAHSGTMGASNVSSIGVTCSPMTFSIGGSVSGLVTNTNVTLHNGSDTVAVSNGSYTFPTAMAFNSSYAATLTSPSGQTCLFSPTNSNVGTVPAAAVTSINVTCGPQTYSLGGTVSGLVSNTNVTLQDANDTIAVGNGSYTLPTGLPYNTAYTVTLTSPSGQTCAFTGGHSGTLGAANVTTINVSCSPLSYPVGGVVSGLVGNTNVTLLNGSDSISVTNGNYTFPTQVAYHSPYAASLTSPAGQTCTFSPTNSNASTMPAAAVTTVNVTCGPQTYSLGGTVSGLVSNTNVTLQDANDTIAVGNGSYTLPTGLPYNTAYTVTLTSPSGQTCAFTGGHSGTLGAANVTTINVACSPLSYPVGGVVSGLVGNTNVTLLNGSDSISVTNGNYTFPTQVAYHSPYAASLTSPAGQTCTFSPTNSNTGTMSAAAVTTVNVTCGPQTYTLGGSVSGLVANANVTLQDANDTIAVGNGSYTLPTGLPYNTNYLVTLTSPSGQSCAFVGSHAGTMGAANVSNIAVTCSPLTYALGGAVTGLVNNANVTLQNGNDSLSVGNTSYTFPTAVAYNANYAATLTAPSGHTCSFSPANSNVGTMPAVAVGNVNVVCAPRTYTVGGTISGLVSNTNVTLTQGADSIAVTNGTYTLPTAVAYNSAYNVALISPAGQTCTFSAGHSGTMGAANITNVNLTCSANTYSLGGQIARLGQQRQRHHRARRGYRVGSKRCLYVPHPGGLQQQLLREPHVAGVTKPARLIQAIAMWAPCQRATLAMSTSPAHR